jgi:hypothetical protein
MSKNNGASPNRARFEGSNATEEALKYASQELREGNYSEASVGGTQV